mmetsp:Transcript_4124/g.12427  ORF Transcript_4124/g.12427 Transcript_4124/m.12427 type:complete len:215 (+) Transcript_4124:161-805(+)
MCGTTLVTISASSSSEQSTSIRALTAAATSGARAALTSPPKCFKIREHTRSRCPCRPGLPESISISRSPPLTSWLTRSSPFSPALAPLAHATDSSRTSNSDVWTPSSSPPRLLHTPHRASCRACIARTRAARSQPGSPPPAPSKASRIPKAIAFAQPARADHSSAAPSSLDSSSLATAGSCEIRKVRSSSGVAGPSTRRLAASSTLGTETWRGM